MRQDIQKGHSEVAEGSIYDAANKLDQKPEEVLADADVVIMLDCSGSMSTYSGNSTRYELACEAVKDIQRAYPGRVALISFDSVAKLELGGIPRAPGGSTRMLPALEIAHNFDGMDTKFYMISDGRPDYGTEDEILRYSDNFVDPINSIFIGGDEDVEGMEFLARLSKRTGGKDHGKIMPKMLGYTMKLLIAKQ